MVPLVLERKRGETQLWVKEVKVGEDRYLVSRNDAGREGQGRPPGDHRRPRGTAQEGRQGTGRQLGLPALPQGQRQELQDVGTLAEEAGYDGITVVRTNAKVTPLQAVLRYRDLLEIESLFAPPRQPSITGRSSTDPMPPSPGMCSARS